jgi:hypothetical protein
MEMEDHRAFIQEGAVEDEEWKWSPVYLLLRDFSGLSAYLPIPGNIQQKNGISFTSSFNLNSLNLNFNLVVLW